MNENQLRSWRPRQSSATLKTRIFALANAPQPAAPHHPWFWGGLVPTMACALLTLMVVHQNSGIFGPSPRRGIIFSPQSGFVNPVDSERSVQNQLAAVTFEWTNRSEFTSSIGFTPITNLSN